MVLFFVDFNGWLHSETYSEAVNQALSGNLGELNGYSYVSDGTSWHRSAQFEEWCDKYNIELCAWPGYSLDFNAIELVWNIIKQKIKPKKS